MFGLRRKSRKQLVRQELVQSAEHFRQAATHAARGAGATVGPRVNAARDRVQPAAGRVKDAASSSWGSTIATLAPLAAALTDGARQADKQGKQANKRVAKAAGRNAAKAQKKSDSLRKRTDKAFGRKKAKPKSGKLAGLLLAGAAVGAGAAFVLRRRQQEKWDEYDPSRPIGSADQGATDSLSGAVRPSDAAFDVDPASPVFGETVIATPPAVADSGLSVGAEKQDQTSSTQHSPTVARMASGTKDH